MRYLTLDICKKHSYIEHDLDDKIVELYANAAERVVENYLECPLAEFEKDGNLPEDIINGMLLCFGSLYANREGFSTLPSHPTASALVLLNPYKTYGIARR